MRLYFTPGACSLAPHIVARELGLQPELVKVDLGTKVTSDKRDFNTINPKGYIPALELDDGRILTEAPAIMQYLADLHPEKGLAHAAGSFERAKVHEWLNFIGTELHRNFGALHSAASEQEKEASRQKLHHRLGFAEKALAKDTYLVADRFSLADAYLYTVLSWCSLFGLDYLKTFPALRRYMDNLSGRESIIAATGAEQAA